MSDVASAESVAYLRPMVELAILVESLLFVAPEAVKITVLADALEETPERIEEALADLMAGQAARGVRVQRQGERVQMISAPEGAAAIERFLGLDLTTKLSPAALETLAIIAYRQPVTRAQIDELRGVASDGVLRTLVHRGLVEQGERLEQAGRPFQFRTTFDFLQHFGLQSLGDLPLLEQAEEDTLAPNGADVNVAEPAGAATNE
ncbi:MAG TPA: SMC-Scp complex subunit ScpB [Anaerolineae bacterium]|nr:SMC-Scp complex subunit ScpB [Anaerolineae bacterium]